MEIFSLLLSNLTDWLVFKLLSNFIYNLSIKMKTYISSLLLFIKSSSPPTQIINSPNPIPFPNLTKTHIHKFTTNPKKPTIVVDINGALLKPYISSSSFFPFFMLVSFEGGNIIRAFLLLIFYPLYSLLSHEMNLKAMIFITFCGMTVEAVENVGRTVLPKFYLEEINPLVYELWELSKGKTVITSVPRVMVDWFCREYLGANDVLGTELHSINGVFTGFIGASGLLVKHNALKEYFGDSKPDVAIGIQSNCLHDHLFISLCKEAYVVSKDTQISSLPRNKYPKPLVFHDGRLAFLPTPLATLTMFLYLPLAIPLSVFRLVVGTTLPFPICTPINCFSGLRIIYSPQPNINKNKHIYVENNSHVLYVSCHRTLLDPVFLSVVLQKPLTALTYSLSRFSEIISPIPTVRLTRNRAHDARTMQRLLNLGDLIVCPEGTTCREPYLLRFSSLFAELTDDIVPVAVEADVSMFYGTTASGYKWLDPIFFMMNPRPGYAVRVLEKVPPEMTCGGGGKSSFEVANFIQKKVAEALGFECTGFTRKDKYMMLAGNEGFVGGGSTSSVSDVCY